MTTNHKCSSAIVLVWIAALGLVTVGCSEMEAPTAEDAGQQSLLREHTSLTPSHDLVDDDGTLGFHFRRLGHVRELGFHFLSMADAGVDAQGVNHRILMTGTGRFNKRHVVGGGFFNHFDVGSAVPMTLLAAGTWRAERVISFSQTDHPENPWGFNLSGIIEMKVRLFPAGGPRHGIPGTLTMVCNIPPAGILTGLPEGYFLDVAGLSFAPAAFPGGFPFGITSFSVNPGDDD